MSDGPKEFAFAAKRAGAKDKAKNTEVIDTFILEGETFSVREVPTARLAHLISAVNSADGMAAVGRVFDFMERALLPGDAKRFEKLLLELEIDEVMEVFQHVLTLVSEGKAGGSSSASSASSGRNGRASTATARARA